MLLAWRSALSTAGFGEDERALTRGVVACFMCGGLPYPRFGSVCMTCETLPLCCRVETLERVGGDFARDALGRKWGDPPLKRDRSPG
jgi:hypothetical protein